MNLLESEIGNLKSELLEMAFLTKEQIDKTITALYHFDKDLAQEVLKNEKRLNASELKMDAKCEQILALFNPKAMDLRYVMACMKMVSDLERIGDNAGGICGYLQLFAEPFDAKLVADLRLREMTDIIQEMLHTLTESLETDSTRLARSLFSKDEIVDGINHQATEIISRYCMQVKDEAKSLQALYLLSIIRKMERVGDYSTNVAEEIIFYVKAKVLRHKRDKYQE